MNTPSQNMKNRTTNKGIVCEFFDELTLFCIPFLNYGKYDFEDYFIDTKTNDIYFHIAD